MQYFSQILYILLFSLIGEVLQAVIPLSIPAAVYGLVLLFLALSTGLLKEEKVAGISDFLIRHMSILFVAPAVKILQYWDLISPKLGAVIIISALPTLLVFALSGLLTKWLQRRKEGKENG